LATSPRRSSMHPLLQGSRERARVPGSRRRAAIRRSYRSVVPDLEIEVQDQVIDGEHVVCRWVARGTNRGRRATLTGITISEIADGKIVVRSSPVGAFAQTPPSMGKQSSTRRLAGHPLVVQTRRATGGEPGARIVYLSGSRDRCPVWGFPKRARQARRSLSARRLPGPASADDSDGGVSPTDRGRARSARRSRASRRSWSRSGRAGRLR
jgi:predicted ester cyclase